jgi:tetratricopeptide (TPR) repeat protein
MATHKKLTRKDPFEDYACLDIAEIYLKMGLREDALAQYRILVQHYKSLGMKDKALKLMAVMAGIDPSKADPEKKITGLKHLTKLKDRGAPITGSEEGTIPEASIRGKGKEAYFDLGAELEIAKPEGTGDYKEIETSEQATGCGEIFKKLREISSTSSMGPNFNYNMGVACRELGFIDDAIEQFQIAYGKRENRFESARLLGLCFKEKTMWAEASQAFEKALEEDGISQGDTLAVKCELGLIFKEQGKTEEALELFRNNPAVDQRFRNEKDGANTGTKKSARK